MTLDEVESSDGTVLLYVDLGFCKISSSEGETTVACFLWRSLNETKSFNTISSSSFSSLSNADVIPFTLSLSSFAANGVISSSSSTSMFVLDGLFNEILLTGLWSSISLYCSHITGVTLNRAKWLWSTTSSTPSDGFILRETSVERFPGEMTISSSTVFSIKLIAGFWSNRNASLTSDVDRSSSSSSSAWRLFRLLCLLSSGDVFSS